MKYHLILGLIVAPLAGLCGQFAAGLGVLAWVVFLSWAGFFAAGGKIEGLKKISLSSLVGYAGGYAAFELASMSTMSNPILLPLAGVLFVICALGGLSFFFVPGAFLACASYFGGGALPWETFISLLIGIILGYLSEFIALKIYNSVDKKASFKSIALLFIPLLSVFFAQVEKAEAREYQIGGQFTLTYSNGLPADWGVYALHASRIAIDDVNRSGILGEDTLVMKEENVIDIHCAAQGMEQLGEAMFANPELEAVIGVDCTDPALAMAPIAERYKTPIISYGERSEAMSKIEDYPFFVTSLAPSSYFEQVLFEVVRELKFDFVGNIHTTDQWGITSSEMIADKCESMGVEVGGTYGYPKNSSFSTVYSELSKAKAKGIKIYFTSMSAPDHAIFFQAVKALNMDTEGYAYLSSELLSPNQIQMSILGSIGKLAPSVTMPTTPEFIEFTEKMSKSLNEPIDLQSSAMLWGVIAYEPVWMLAHAIAAGKADGLTEVTNEDLMKYIRKVEFEGFTGKVSIKENANNRKVMNIALLNAQGFAEEASYISRWLYTIKNPAGPKLSYVQVGALDDENNFTFDASKVIWPGGTNQIPMCEKR